MRLKTGFFKKFVIELLWAGRIYEFIKPQDEWGARILMYHRFDSCLKPFKLSQATFSKQIEFVLSKFRVLSLKEIVERISAGQPLPKRSLCITVDDGYEDFYLYAYPVLARRGVSATVFLTTGFVDNKQWLWADRLAWALQNTEKKTFDFRLGDRVETFNVSTDKRWHESQLRFFAHLASLPNQERVFTLRNIEEFLEVEIPTLPTKAIRALTWHQVNEMGANGIDFGAHSVSHAILTKVSEKELLREVMESKYDIEKCLCRSISIFCYPNGSYDNHVVEAVKRAGFRGAVTTDSGFNSEHEDVFRLKRISVSENPMYYFARKMFFPSD
jgi:peptidoglycan/xylan/chitin deacetylase (PgdA/CDA1 family)